MQWPMCCSIVLCFLETFSHIVWYLCDIVLLLPNYFYIGRVFFSIVITSLAEEGGGGKRGGGAGLVAYMHVHILWSPPFPPLPLGARKGDLVFDSDSDTCIGFLFFD